MEGTKVELNKEEVDVLNAIFQVIRRDQYGSLDINFAHGKVQNIVKNEVEVYRRRAVDNPS